MIRINDDYVINVDPLNYVVCKDLHRIDKRGYQVMQTLGYLDSLPKALAFLVRKLQTEDLISDDEISLKEAIERMNSRFEEMEKLIKESVPDVRVDMHIQHG